jgi:hypothetical protein
MRTASALAWLLVPGLLWAAPAAPDKGDQAAGPAEGLRKDLDKPVTLKIDKLSLTAAIDALRDKSKLAIILDSLTIQQQLGFTPDQPPTPVQADFKDVKARKALRTILAPYGLSYAVVGDTIIVTTEGMAMMRQLRQRVSVDVNKLDLAAALRQIGRETCTNLILDARAEKEAKVEVSLQAEDVPLETAVRLLAEMAGLKPVRVGNTLFVTKKDIAAEMRNDPDLGQQQGQQAVPVVSYGVPGGQPVPGGAVFIGNGINVTAPIGTAPNPPVLVPPPAIPPVVPPPAGAPGAPPPAGAPGTPPPATGMGTGATTPAPPDVKKVIDEDAPKSSDKTPPAEATPEKKDDKK